ncbi:MAG: hypothetical protein PUD02_03180, partial [Eggerthellales bacterium]|nr:hypothetical protein [Eggerthellales bacterium]
MSYNDAAGNKTVLVGTATEEKVSGFFEADSGRNTTSAETGGNTSVTTTIIGASGVGFTVKLARQPLNGNVTDITTEEVSKGVGSTVSFTARPEDGYRVASVVAVRADGSGTTVPTMASGNTYSFTTPDHNVVVTVVLEPIPAPPVYIPEPDPTPSVTPSSPTGIDDFGTISGVSDRMEYKLEGTDAWTDVPADVTQLTGLPAGTYLIRYKGYSAYTKVVVAAAPAYAVEVKPAAGGTATADKATAMKGEAVTFSATADKGFNLRGWMIGDEFIEADSITMPASDITVEPVFTPVQKLFTANAKASTDRATLSWKPVEGAMKYRVYLAKADGKLKRVTTIEVPAAEEGEVIDEAAIQAACAY